MRARHRPPPAPCRPRPRTRQERRGVRGWPQDRPRGRRADLAAHPPPAHPPRPPLRAPGAGRAAGRAHLHPRPQASRLPLSRVMRGAAGALLAVALVLGGCGASSEPRQQTKPNVLVLLTDDQTIESMRVMAGVRGELGASGTTFEQAFVSNPLCCPSRATLYTGQYTHNHGVIGNRPPEGGYGRLDKSEWLPLWLQRAGYHTVHIGKFMNRYGQDSPPTEVPPGWDEWYTSVDPSTYSFTEYQLNENGALRWHGEYSTDEYSDLAVDAVKRLPAGHEPLFPPGASPPP